MKISKLTYLCNYEFVGEDLDVDSVKYADVATNTSIAIIRNKEDIEKTKANCILLPFSVINTKKTIIYTCDPIELAAVNLTKKIASTGSNKDKIQYQKKGDYFIGKNINIGEDTIISPNVFIGNNVIIGKNCYFEPNVYIGNGTIIKDNVYIGSGSSVGSKSFYHYYEDGSLKEFAGTGITIINSGVCIGNDVTIQRGTFSNTNIGENCKIGNLIDIGHDVYIGKNCKIVSQTGIASNVKIGNYVQIYGQVGIANDISIGNNVIIHGRSIVTKNICDNKTISFMNIRANIKK